MYLPNLRLQESCSKYADTNWVFNKKSVVISGLGVMAYGAYIGVLIQAKYFPKMDWPFMLFTDWKKLLLRMLVVIALGGPFGAIFLVVPQTASLGVSIVFKTFVPLLLAQISMFGFSNYWFIRFNLVEDSGRSTIPKTYVALDKEPEKYH